MKGYILPTGLKSSFHHVREAVNHQNPPTQIKV